MSIFRTTERKCSFLLIQHVVDDAFSFSIRIEREKNGGEVKMSKYCYPLILINKKIHIFIVVVFSYIQTRSSRKQTISLATIMSSSTGKCLCKQIIVSITQEVFSAGQGVCLCHCINCCRAGGSLGSINIIAPESAVKITGEPKIYQDTDTDSGKPLTRAFCENCGSSIYSSSPNMPGLLVIKLGLFDEIPKPSMELYCKSRASWDKAIDGATQFDTMPSK